MDYICVMDNLPITVVETAQFLRRTQKLMDDNERAVLIDYLARNPESGVLIPETGGVRKLRWALEGRGKRGGARIIYYFHSENIPLFVVSAYAKNERADLSAADRNDFKRLTKILVESYGKKVP